MSEKAIKIDHLGKKFFIGHKKEGDLRTSLTKKIGHLLGGQKMTDEVFWALRDISFEIKKGEAVGIIGRNGAGKSTLLKILSRITEPSSGRIEINGRVASLLEVGTGFHPELTGRENIFLNGAILGMSRAEVRRKFDEIAGFSGVERFLDTPVKRYSSGMYVRLAFAVAAHLEPDVLIVDEVLAVGDAAFQKKSLGKMEDVSRSGRTVLLVSHNMASIKKLSSSVLYLRDGSVVTRGAADDVIRSYIEEDVAGQASIEIPEAMHRVKSAFQIRKIELLDESGMPAPMFRRGEAVTIRLTVAASEAVRGARVGIAL